MASGQEPIEDSEVLYRRIPATVGYYQQGQNPSPLSFRPGPADLAGLSLYRRKYASAEHVAAMGLGKSYYVAVLEAGSLREQGLHLVPKPDPVSLGHAEIADLTFANRRDDRSEGIQVLLAQRLCREVLGPFPGKGPMEGHP